MEVGHLVDAHQRPAESGPDPDAVAAVVVVVLVAADGEDEESRQRRQEHQQGGEPGCQASRGSQVEGGDAALSTWQGDLRNPQIKEIQPGQARKGGQETGDDRQHSHGQQIGYPGLLVEERCIAIILRFAQPSFRGTVFPWLLCCGSKSPRRSLVEDPPPPIIPLTELVERHIRHRRGCQQNVSSSNSVNSPLFIFFARKPC